MNRRGRLRSPWRRIRAGSNAPCEPARSICAQNLAWIHDAFRIEGAFQEVHDAQFHRVGAAREFVGLEPPDAVFGADTAAETLDQIEHGQLEGVCPGDEGRQLYTGLLAQVEMQVAVAGMAIGNDVSLGRQFMRQCRAFLDQCWNRGHRNGHVMLDACPVAELRLGYGLTRSEE